MRRKREVLYLLSAVHDISLERRAMGTYRLRHEAIEDGKALRHDARGHVTPWGYHVERISLWVHLVDR